MDHACRVFRYVREGNRRFIEVKQKNGWKRTEEIDCSKAKRDVFGTFSYFPKSIQGEIFCPNSVKAGTE